MQYSGSGCWLLKQQIMNLTEGKYYEMEVTNITKFRSFTAINGCIVDDSGENVKAAAISQVPVGDIKRALVLCENISDDPSTNFLTYRP